MNKLLSIILIAGMGLTLFVGFGANNVEAAAPLIPQVTNLKVEELRNGYVNISFDPVAGASHYVAKRNGSNIGNINYQTYLEHYAPMTAGTKYTYEISAVVNGVQGLAGSISITAPEKTPSPTNVKGTSNSPTSIQLSWDPVPNATDYVISLNPNRTRVGISTVPGYDHTGLQPKTPYIYYIQARIGDVYSDPVSVIVNTLSSVPLSAPTDFKVTDKTHNSISLSWTAVTGADNYVITDVNNGNVVYDGALTSTTISNLTPDTDYTFKLVAKDHFGQTSPSTSVSETTEPIPQVTNLKVEELRNGYVNISFDPVAGASHYVAKRNGSNIGNINYQTYLEHYAPMTAGTKYTYEISAVVNGVQGPAGSITIIAPEKTP